MDVKVLIPAAGRGSRSGLEYPKCLYRLAGVPILARICKIFSVYDAHPVIIINSRQQPLFIEAMAEFGIDPVYVFQDDPKGMGDAILKADDHFAPDTHILLTWSDIPFISPQTIRNLVNCHDVCRNDFSMVTSVGENCYTIVKRDNGRVTAVKETRALGIPPLAYGEREMGLFVFKKDPVFSLLAKDAGEAYENGKKEHGFLYVIEKMVGLKLRVEGYPIARQSDLLSFNSPADLSAIEAYIQNVD